MRRRHHGPHCGCPKCIVHPVKHNTVHTCSESEVLHVHPSHTTVVNHHLVKNQHIFPHSTSFQNVTNSVDQFGPSFEVPGPGFGPGQVAGAMQPGVGPGAMMPGGGPGQVAGAMQPGCGPGQVAGAMQPGYGMGPWNKPKKGC